MTTPGIVTSVLRTRATCVVSIRGELDWQSSPDFDHSVANLASWRPALLAVDLRCLEYIDSVGVESLAVLRDEIARQGGRTVLANVPEIARRRLQLAGLADHFTIHLLEGTQPMRSVLGAVGDRADGRPRARRTRACLMRTRPSP